jgi:hypothetical protein
MFKESFGNQNLTNTELKNKLIEIYELLILSELYSSKFRNLLVLKGLVAADLAYGVKVSSSKIEFITLGEIKPIEFMSEINAINKKFPNIMLGNQEDQRYTFTLELIIHESDDLNIELSIEFTKIMYKLKRGLNFDARVIALKDWTIKPVVLVLQLPDIIKDNPDTLSLNNIGFNQYTVRNYRDRT